MAKPSPESPIEEIKRLRKRISTLERRINKAIGIIDSKSYRTCKQLRKVINEASEVLKEK